MSRPKRSKQPPLNAHSPLLPGLPDHLSIIPLSSLPPSLLFRVCHSWRRLLFSPSFPSPHLSIYLILASSTPTTSSLLFTSFDPVSSSWSPLPPPPLPRPVLLRHPSFLSRPLPLQSASSASSLLLVSATASPLVPLLSRPLLFHPSLSKWTPGPPFTSPRRWCALGSDPRGRVFLASGVGAHYSADVARSFEMWDPATNVQEWIPLKPLKDGRFSREATDMVHSNGKMCMVSMKGRGLKEGAVYDLESDHWSDMPPGLLNGWNGPVATVDSIMYGVEEGDTALKKYRWEDDKWTVVMNDTRLKGAIMIVGSCGKLCIACHDGALIVVVDVRDGHGIWTVKPPADRTVIGMHILRRIARS